MGRWYGTHPIYSRHWLDYGVDGDNDGRRSPWVTADALSSTANYLSKSGWVRGLSPFYEVNLPANFDYGLLGQKLWVQAGAMGISLLMVLTHKTRYPIWDVVTGW